MVYRYTGVSRRGEDHVETGVVVAQDKSEAQEKLRPFGYEKVSFKTIRGWAGLISRITANVK